MSESAIKTQTETQSFFGFLSGMANLPQRGTQPESQHSLVAYEVPAESLSQNTSGESIVLGIEGNAQSSSLPSGRELAPAIFYFLPFCRSVSTTWVIWLSLR